MVPHSAHLYVGLKEEKWIFNPCKNPFFDNMRENKKETTMNKLLGYEQTMCFEEIQTGFKRLVVFFNYN